MSHLPDTRQGEHVRTTHEVKQATWSGHEKVTTTSQLTDLITNWGTTVRDTWTHHRTIAQTTCFVEDLAAQLTGWRNDQDQWLCPNTITSSIESGREIWSRSSELLDLAHEFGNARNQEGRSLARS